MNKKQAEIYITKSLNLSKTTSRSHQYKFLLLNIVCLIISIALYRSSAFVVFVSLIVITNIFMTVFLAKKPAQILKVHLLIFIQLIVFSIALNCLIFGMYHMAQKFVLWEFVLSIIIQMTSCGISYFFVKNHAKKFKANEKISKNEMIAGTMAGFSYALTLVFCRIFSPSLSAIITPLAILLNLLICLIGVGTISALYRVYLLKKFKISQNDIDINY